jgi:hypothetical protein
MALAINNTPPSSIPFTFPLISETLEVIFVGRLLLFQIIPLRQKRAEQLYLLVLNGTSGSPLTRSGVMMM